MSRIVYRKSFWGYVLDSVFGVNKVKVEHIEKKERSTAEKDIPFWKKLFMEP